MKIFEIYKAEETKIISLKDIINYDKLLLKNTVFILAPKYSLRQDKFFNIKIHQLIGENDN